MQHKTVTTTKFSKFNNKKICFSDSVTSLSLSHPHLKDLNNYMEGKSQRTEKYFGKKKINCLQWKTILS